MQHSTLLRRPCCRTTLLWYILTQCATCALLCSEPTNGAEVVVDILEHIGQEKVPQPHGLGPQAATALKGSLRKSGSIRLKDALMVAHLMQQESADQQVCYRHCVLAFMYTTNPRLAQLCCSHCSRCCALHCYFLSIGRSSSLLAMQLAFMSCRWSFQHGTPEIWLKKSCARPRQSQTSWFLHLVSMTPTHASYICPKVRAGSAGQGSAAVS